MIILSFPRSGRTWLIRMLANYLSYYNANKHFSKVGKDLLMAPLTDINNIIPSSFVIGYHNILLEELEIIQHKYNMNTVYLLRDPRDCLASLYYYNTTYYQNRGIRRVLRQLKYNFNMKYFIQSNIREWRKHVDDYLHLSDKTIKYEDLNVDCYGTLYNLLKDEVSEIDRSKLRDVVEENKFDNITSRKKGEENKKNFYRKGIIGDWYNHFNQPKYKNIIKDEVGSYLIEHGYENDINW